MLNKILGSDCVQDSKWAKGVFETIRRSKVYKPEKVLEILESRDQKNKSKIKGKNEIFVLVIHSWGTLRNIPELF